MKKFMLMTLMLSYITYFCCLPDQVRLNDAQYQKEVDEEHRCNQAYITCVLTTITCIFCGQALGRHASKGVKIHAESPRTAHRMNHNHLINNPNNSKHYL